MYKAQGEYKEVLVQLEKSLEIKIQVMGPDSHDVATSYNNIGGVYMAPGEHKEALVQYQKSLGIRIRCLVRILTTWLDHTIISGRCTRSRANTKRQV